MKQSQPALAFLAERLAGLEAEGLFRARPPIVPDVARSFCSNDYLGLAGETAASAPTGSGASRLIVGERVEHAALEKALAGWLGVESALLFSSGYAANIGVVSALAQAGDLVVSDALNHASIIDGCRLSRARVEVVPHLDLGAIRRLLERPRQGRAWVVTESYFSMDADTPDLAALRSVCDEHGAALIVDEAHALGVFGPRGRGLCAQSGVSPDVLVGTLGKAFGVGGAFVAGSELLVRWLWNRARSFVFSTGLSPASAAAALRALRIIVDEPTRRDRLHANAERLREGLDRNGLPVLGYGPIIPVVLGEARAALLAAEGLRREGIHVQAVRPPTVPAGSARLRITATAAQTPDDIERAVSAFERRLSWFPPSY